MPDKVMDEITESMFAAMGIQTPSPTSGNAPAARLARAEAMMKARNYSAAMIECVDLSRSDPHLLGLPELQAKIMEAMSDERAKALALQKSSTSRRMQLDIDQQEALPNTYGLQRNVKGLVGPLRTAPSKMQQVLDKKVTVHLDGVTLNDFIMAVGASENINIIADDSLTTGGGAPAADGAPAAAAGPTLTLHAEDVPLSEILDYISRNLGVKLYVGENVLWVTPGTKSQDTAPLETRIYRLRKGLSSEELGVSTGAGAGGGARAGAGPGARAGELKLSILDAIDRFVPKETGADVLFDKKTHTLIVKDSRQNLAKIEALIETLDICPPQVLIEARFISTGVSDLRELGIDWILNSPIAVSKKAVIRDGARTLVNETQVNATAPESIVGFTPFPNAAQGLNFSFQGLLTEPMFTAVLHALETSGKSQTLSVPKVTTVNNRTAQLRIGEDFRYFQEYDVQSVPTSVTDAGSQVYSSILVPVGTPQLEELGIQLSVTPSVGADMTSVTIHLAPELSEFVRYESYEVAAAGGTSGTASTNSTSLVKLPIFRRSKLETEMIVQSGETVAMGGLILSTETKSEQGVPILSQIPLLGRLFRYDSVETSRKNLLIFVTATILSERGETLIPMETGTGAAPGI